MDVADCIEWDSSKSHLLLNPRMPEEGKKSLMLAWEAIELKDHVVMTTSGSSGSLKCAALCKKAILASAEAVNRHLKSTASDRWLNPLPLFHVGGLGIKARGYLTGAFVFECPVLKNKWDPHQFVKRLLESKATLTSLVPTQIFDLVRENLDAPDSLRAVVVGGGALSEVLYEQARQRHWNLLPSYGLTECASQVATATLESLEKQEFPLLRPLDHVQLRLNAKGTLDIKSDSLLSYYLEFDGASQSFCLHDPKTDGWLSTQDKAVFIEGWIKTISREENVVKIGGENVDILRLETILETLKLSYYPYLDMALFSMPDERLGHVIHLAVAGQNTIDLTGFINDFHARIHPYERIRSIYYVESIPRTSLNKVIRSSLVKCLSF